MPLHQQEVRSPAIRKEPDHRSSRPDLEQQQTHPGSDSFARLRAAAADSPATRTLTTLQRRADTRGQSQEPPRAPTRSLARNLPLPSLQRKSAPGTMASSRLAMTTALSPTPAHDPSLIPVPNGNEIAMQRVATSAQEPMPGTPTAVGSPLLDSLGMTATSMSNEEYAHWSDTIQCKMGVHGKQQMGDRTIVTQFKPDWMKWPEWMKTVGRFFLKHKAKFNAGLVIVEAGLTIAAALTGLSAATSVGALNLMLSAIVGAVVGVAKLIRGFMMMRQAFQKQEDKSELTTVMIEAIRTTEAIGSAVALGIAAPGAIPMIAGLIFASAKAVRSFIAVYNDILAEEIAKLATENAEGSAEAIAALKTKQKKAQIAMTVAHALESVAILVGGGLTLDAGLQGGSDLGSAMDNAKEIGGSIALGVGASKGARTVLGYPYKGKGDPQANQDADAGPQAFQDIGGGALPADQELGVVDNQAAASADDKSAIPAVDPEDEGIALPETTNKPADVSLDDEGLALPETTK